MDIYDESLIKEKIPIRFVYSTPGGTGYPCRHYLPAFLLLEHPQYSSDILTVIENYYDHVFRTALKMSNSLKKTENPSLLEGLI